MSSGASHAAGLDQLDLLCGDHVQVSLRAMPRKAKSPARAEATGDWDHREAAPASQLDAFGFRKKSAYTPDDAHKVDTQIAWPGSKINPGSDQGTPMRYGKKVYVEKTD